MRRIIVTALHAGCVTLALGCSPVVKGDSATDGDETTDDAPPPTTDDAPPPATGEPDEPPPPEEGWEPVVDDLPFPLDGPDAVTKITVGNKSFNDNFANRGRVEVLYDRDDATIAIELKKYVLGPGEVDLTQLSLWAFANGGQLVKPSAVDPAKDCTKDAWKDDCLITVYYDGQSQPLRTGGDLRVHLPRAFHGQLVVRTEDNTHEDDFPRRSDVRIADLCGSGDVTLAAGVARVELCDDLAPTPTCPPEQVAACASWPDGAWAPDCPCAPSLYGQLRVESTKPWAGDVTVDIPPGLWASATLQNTSESKPHNCKPVVDDCGEACEVTAPDAYSAVVNFNHPSEAAPAGGGYAISARSGGCTVIPFVAGPADWSPDVEPEEEMRGFLRACVDCLE